MSIVNKEIQAFYTCYNVQPNEYTKLRYDLLTTIVYAQVTVNSDGSISPGNLYNPEPLIQYAHDRGVKVVLMFKDTTTISADTVLASPVLRTTLIQNLLNEAIKYNFDGIDNDIENIQRTNPITGTPNRALLTAFHTELADTFWSKNPNYRISIDLPPNYSYDIWDITVLQNKVNYMMIMGYDYTRKTSPYAGPNAPIDRDSPTENSIRNSIKYYSGLMDKKKLLLGVPWYGYEWPTVDNTRLSSTTGTGKNITYKNYIDIVNGYGRIWDPIWKTPWYTRQDNITKQWYQGHYDDLESLSVKYDLAKSEGLGGIGIWALVYGTDRTELWQLIQYKFGFVLGQNITDTVNITGIPGIIPTGNVIFESSNDSGTTWKQIGVEKMLDSNGKTISDLYMPQSTDVYYFRAKYLGDVNYNAKVSGDKDEQLIVGKADPIVTTFISSNTIVLGQNITDTVNITGIPGIIPTGNVIFESSNDSGTTWKQIGVEKMLDSNGKTISDLYMPQSTDVYYFRAKYLGDVNYNAKVSGDKDEQLIVGKADPIVITYLNI